MTTTQQSKASQANAMFEFPSVEETTQHIRDLNERLIEASKSAGLVALDAFEKALQSFEDFDQKLASASGFDAVSAAATTRSKFISDLSSTYTTVARDLLK